MTEELKVISDYIIQGLRDRNVSVIEVDHKIIEIRMLDAVGGYRVYLTETHARVWRHGLYIAEYNYSDPGFPDNIIRDIK